MEPASSRLSGNEQPACTASMVYVGSSSTCRAMQALSAGPARPTRRARKPWVPPTQHVAAAPAGIPCRPHANTPCQRRHGRSRRSRYLLPTQTWLAAHAGPTCRGGNCYCMPCKVASRALPVPLAGHAIRSRGLRGNSLGSVSGKAGSMPMMQELIASSSDPAVQSV